MKAQILFRDFESALRTFLSTVATPSDCILIHQLPQEYPPPAKVLLVFKQPLIWAEMIAAA